ncbi:MAG: gamma-glutamyltransferase [Proteobacteria bacterium]|nr:gamma-glutamyltransferase [Pseudomonadota bacterium]MCP4917018.1 gamma-glutamyltransferase [Pseudomonadota bacterium]
MRRPLALLAVSAVLLAAAPPPLTGTSGMVAADHELASWAGAQMLQRGGNAADAAVAAALAAGVVQPAGSGIGGGGFAVVVDGTERTVLDFREVAPSAGHADMYLDESGEVVPNLSRLGGLAVGVPGEPRGLAQLAAEQGSLPLRDLVRPARELAKKGFDVEHHLLKALGSKPHMAALLFAGTPEAVALGQRVKRPALARTLDAWARSGGEALNVGALAEGMAESIQSAGGVLTPQDLADYAPVTREPLVGSYRGYTIITMPPPSSGGAALLQVLGVLESHDLAGLGHNSSDHLHLLAEAMKHAYADRAEFMGDPDFVDVPVDQMLDPARIEAIQADIWPTRTFPLDHYGTVAALPDDAGTQHISVVDASGMAVALTTTINTSFGSQVVDAASGVLFNNEMDDFIAQPGVPNAYGLVGKESNAVEPGKRPLSSMTPTVVLDPEGNVVLALGASGGPFIISSTLQVLSNVVDFGMDPELAVSAPRMHHQWMPELLFMDHGMPADVHRNLQARGHTIKEMGFFSSVQIVAVDDGEWTGASDPRKGGGPAL